jgi:hypothetical protein
MQRWYCRNSLTNLVREIANANAVERRCRVSCVEQRSGSNGDIDEKNSSPGKIV